jgi:hypothetical protein
VSLNAMIGEPGRPAPQNVVGHQCGLLGCINKRLPRLNDIDDDERNVIVLSH